MDWGNLDDDVLSLEMCTELCIDEVTSLNSILLYHNIQGGSIERRNLEDVDCGNLDV